MSSYEINSIGDLLANPEELAKDIAFLRALRNLKATTLAGDVPIIRDPTNGNAFLDLRQIAPTTGQTSQPIVPDPSGQAGNVLLTDGSNAYWGDLPEIIDWKKRVAANNGTLTANSAGIARRIVVNLHSKSYYSKIKWLWPLLGANLNAAIVPLIDRIGAGVPVNNNFVDADFSEALGLQGDGNVKYLETNIHASSLGSNANGGIGWWEGNVITGTGHDVPMGYQYNPGPGTDSYAFVLGSSKTEFQWNQDLAANNVIANVAAVSAHYYGQRSSATSRVLYKDAAQLANSTASDAAAAQGNGTFIVMGDNPNNVQTGGVYCWGGRCAVAYMTDGTLTADEITDLDSVLRSNLINALGRGSVSVTDNWKARLLSNGGTLTANSYSIASALVAQMQTRSYYSKIVYLLPFLGGNMKAAIVPLIDLRGVPLPKITGFVDGDFSETTGLQGNGTSKYLSTFLSPSSLNPTDGDKGNGGIGWWESHFTGAGNSEPLGSYASGGSERYVLDLRSTREFVCWGSTSGLADGGVAASNGNYYGQRSAANLRALYKGGTKLATNTSSLSLTDNKELMDVCGSNDYSGSAFVHTPYPGRGAVAYMTTGMLSDSEVTDLHNDLNTYLIAATGRPS